MPDATILLRSRLSLNVFELDGKCEVAASVDGSGDLNVLGVFLLVLISSNFLSFS